LNRLMPDFPRRLARSLLLVAVAGGVLLALSGQGGLARAQATSDLTAQIAPPDVSAFPSVSTRLWVYTVDGQFVSGLKAEDVAAIEDGQALPLDSLEEQEPGAQFVVAVNPGPALAVRDVSAVSRYDKIRTFLQDWVSRLPSTTPDDLSLVSSLGTVSGHADPETWSQALAGFNPDLRGVEPDLQALSAALDVAAESTPRPGMGRAVLFITPHLERSSLGGLESLSQRAAQEGVRISVWLVDSDAYYTTFGAQALQNLALQSGGTYATFSGTEALPDPDTMLENLRNVYKLTYSSQIDTAGDHILAVSVSVGDEQVTSPNQSLNVHVEPPSAVLVSPPAQITRRTDPADLYNLETYSPTEQQLDLLIEFPDGHSRPLVRTTLLVDGAPVAENTEEPFDTFTWQLMDYMDTSEHDLAVEVEDSLGLTRLSFSVPVNVTVVQPPGGLPALFARNRSLIVTLSIVTAGGVLLFILFTGLRMRPRAGGATRAERRQSRRKAEDPVTQTVAIRTDDRRPAPSPFTRVRRKAPAAPAYLAQLDRDGMPAPGAPIPLHVRELTFGLDPTQATHVLDDSSVSPLHARIRQDDRGGFTLYDQGSVAGTWVNYESIGREGRRLQHGDIVQIGMLTYRFALSRPPAMSRPRVVFREDGET
jgi:hypothetical protein